MMIVICPGCYEILVAEDIESAFQQCPACKQRFYIRAKEFIDGAIATTYLVCSKSKPNGKK